MYCKSCGFEIENDSKYCRRCGYEVNGNSEERERNKSLKKKQSQFLLLAIALALIIAAVVFFLFYSVEESPDARFGNSETIRLLLRLPGEPWCALRGPKGSP